jgi:hypothetical protein
MLVPAGCLYLEFLVWFLAGSDKLEQFTSSRRAETGNKTFHRKSYGDDGGAREWVSCDGFYSLSAAGTVD